MSRNIPFFDMFAELQLSSELRLKLLGAVRTGAAIDQTAMSITLQRTVKNQLPQEEIQKLRECIKEVSGFVTGEINVTCLAPEPPVLPVQHLPALVRNEVAAAASGCLGLLYHPRREKLLQQVVQGA